MITVVNGILLTSAVIQARVNVPGLSERTLERDIVDSGISLGSEVQVIIVMIVMC